MHYFFFIFTSCTQDMLKVTNLYRRMHNLQPLTVIEPLKLASELQANTMCKEAKLTHKNSNPQKKTLRKRMEYFNFTGQNIGENIAKQQNNDFKEVFKVWSKSPLHRKNILGDYKYTGIATCKGKDKNRYWVQVFGKGYGNWKGSPYSKDKEDRDKEDRDKEDRDGMKDDRDGMKDRDKYSKDGKDNRDREHKNDKHKNGKNKYDKYSKYDTDSDENYKQSKYERSYDVDENIIFLVKDSEDIKKIKKKIPKNYKLQYKGSYKKYVANNEKEEEDNLPPNVIPPEEPKEYQPYDYPPGKPLYEPQPQDLMPPNQISPLYETSPPPSQIPPSQIPPVNGNSPVNGIPPSLEPPAIEAPPSGSTPPVPETPSSGGTPPPINTPSSGGTPPPINNSSGDKSDPMGEINKILDNNFTKKDSEKYEDMLKKILKKLEQLDKKECIGECPIQKKPKDEKKDDKKESGLKDKKDKKEEKKDPEKKSKEEKKDPEKKPKEDKKKEPDSKEKDDKKDPEKKPKEDKDDKKDKDKEDKIPSTTSLFPKATVTTTVLKTVYNYETPSKPCDPDKTITMTVSLDKIKEDPNNKLKSLINKIVKKDEKPNLESFIRDLIKSSREDCEDIDIGDPEYQEI